MAIELYYISDPIKRDHRSLKECHRQIICNTDHDEQYHNQRQFICELACHTISKELVMCPVMETHVKGGKALADKDYEEHQIVKQPCSKLFTYVLTRLTVQSKVTEALYRFHLLSPNDDKFMSCLKQLYENLKEHINEEERKYLMALENGIDGEQIENLTKEFHRSKRFLLTHIHRNTPDVLSFQVCA
jgi:hypothetical protein